jgi:hypothetical protein
MYKMGLRDPFGHLKHNLWPKERSGIKLVAWLPTIKSWKAIWFPYMQVACDIPLENSQQEIQLFFRPHLNQRFTRKVMGPQSRKNLKFEILRLPLGNLETKCHFDISLNFLF